MKIIELRNAKVGVERIAPNGKTDFRLTIQDVDTREVMWIGFGQDVADALIEQLTGGIRVVARVPPQ